MSAGTPVPIEQIDAELDKTIINEETDFCLWSARSHLPDDFVRRAITDALDNLHLSDERYDIAFDTYMSGRIAFTAILSVKIGDKVYFICDADGPCLVVDPTQLPGLIFAK